MCRPYGGYEENTEMRTVYIAEDGTEFNDAFNCEFYEWKLRHPYLREIKCYDNQDNPIDNITEESAYDKCEKVIVPTMQSLNDLHALADYMGFTLYNDIKSTGTWVYDEHATPWYGFVKQTSLQSTCTAKVI